MTPGFCILHANRMEDLRALLVEWLREHPLAPLEDEVVLVQNRGMAQWLKLALAEPADAGGHGIAASIDATLPARFLWRAYRAVLGAERVPETSPYDEDALVWRLLRHLPGPLAGRLDADDPVARYRMATRIADLFDQYQVYRADWLNDWTAGKDTAAEVFPWQPELWRALVADIGPGRSRAELHQAFLDALAAARERPTGLPRRIVVFGISSLPRQFIEALAALGRHCQVLLLVNNPCRHFWADIVEDRQFLGEIEQSRHAVSINQNNPLLASWGKQGRDYIGMLYGYDDPEAYAGDFQRIDLFTGPCPADGPATLLQRLQHAVFDLEKTLPEAARETDDGSIALRTAHSRQREVEVLHDHLLALFEADPSLEPRDIVVMAPDVDAYAPHIDAVFGRVAPDDPRHLPWSIADRAERVENPLVRAVDWLLTLPGGRVGLSEVLGLMDVEAIRARFGLEPDDLPRIQAWAAGAGVRWGLHAEQRSGLELPGDYARNSWRHGLDRMLLGYANGAAGPWRDIEPYDEVGGLSAAAVGPLHGLIDALDEAWRVLRAPAPPVEWAERLRALLERFVAARGAEDLMTLARLEDALERWAGHCRDAGLDEALPVEVVREAWLGGLDERGRAPRFLHGRVNFCTLMPMRAIPFRVVCLLGMNDRQFPRQHVPQDFDLMARSYRAGDRSRREDDRYQFLEAVLSARDHLYVSWIGRQARDNAELAPSVLVAQLQDFIGGDRAQAHPLQPFSLRYFTGERGLETYASEWAPAPAATADAREVALAERLPEMPLPLRHIERFMRQPVDYFFTERLGIAEPRELEVPPDHEPFQFDGLERYDLHRRLLDAALLEGTGAAPAAARLERAGELPPGWAGTELRGDAETAVTAVLERLHALELSPQPDLDVAIKCELDDICVEIDDIVGKIYKNGADDALLRVHLLPTKLEKKHYRLIQPWVAHVTLHAAGHRLDTHILAPDTSVIFPSLDQEAANGILSGILGAWRRGLAMPLPVAAKTALAWLEEPAKAASWYEGGYQSDGERGESRWLERCWPDFEALAAADGFEDLARTLYGPLKGVLDGQA